MDFIRVIFLRWRTIRTSLAAGIAMAPDGHLIAARTNRASRRLRSQRGFSSHSLALRMLLCIVAIRRDVRLAAAAAVLAIVVLLYASLLDAIEIEFHASLLMLAVFIAAAVSSVAGFAFSALCGAFLFHLPLGQVQIVQTMMICSIAIQLLSISVLRRSIAWQHLPAFLTGGLVGLPLGLAVLLTADRATFSFLIGLLLCSYSAFMLSGRIRIIAQHSRGLDFIVGVCGGVTGGASAFPGAPVTVWCQMKGWNRDQQRGVFQPFILVMQVAALVFLAGGDIQWPVAPVSWLSWSAIPPALLGAMIGLRCYRGINDVQFTRMVNVMLLISGTLLMMSF